MRLFSRCKVIIHEGPTVEPEQVEMEPGGFRLETGTGVRRFRLCTDPVHPHRYSESFIRANVTHWFVHDNPGSAKILRNPAPFGHRERCGYCGGKVTGEILVEVRRLVVYKTPPTGAHDLKVPQNQGHYYDVKGKLTCQRCGYQWTK